MIIDDVMANIGVDFEEYGMDESVLTSLLSVCPLVLQGALGAEQLIRPEVGGEVIRDQSGRFCQGTE